MTSDLIRSRAMAVLTSKQYDAWRLVEYEGVSKRKAARILCIARPSLDERLTGANRRLDDDVGYIRLISDHDARGVERPGTASEPLQGPDAGQAGGGGGEPGSGGIDGRSERGAEAA